MMPQLGVGGCTPSPMKLRPASSRIAFGIARVAATMSGASVFGRRCLRRMKPLRAPAPREAWTYSWCFSDRSCARTRRAVVNQLVSPRARKTGKRPLDARSMTEATPASRLARR